MPLEADVVIAVMLFLLPGSLLSCWLGIFDILRSVLQFFSMLTCWFLDSEMEEALLRLPDRARIPGSLPYQGFRRNEYSSSPPTRGDSSTYSRGIYGKWDSRSSARSDRDSDSQSDKDSGYP